MTDKSANRRLKNNISYFLYPAVAVVLLLAIWELLVETLGINQALLPAPTAIWSSGVENIDVILRESWPTIYETVVGYILASLVGIVAAICISTVPLIYKSVYPLLVGLLVVPKIAIAPLFVIWFGFGATPKIIMVILIAFFPVVVNMALGLGGVPRELHLLTRSMGASPWRAFWKVSLPSSLPSLFVGLKLAMALAIIGSVVAEFVQSSEGLGFLLLQANSTLDTALFFAAIVALTVIGVVLYEIVEVVERFVLRNRKEL